MGKLILLLLVIGVVVYVLVRLVQTRGRPFGGRPGPRPPVPGRGPGPSRPLGPDDDPDFLRDLNRRRRKRDDTPDS